MLEFVDRWLKGKIWRLNAAIAASVDFKEK
jgi:hypothetical protein